MSESSYVAYMRCSGDSQTYGDTWDRQIEKIHALASRLGFDIEKEWREEGISGKIECEQRPAFQAMLAELLSNGCRTIIVEDLSRLARRYAVDSTQAHQATLGNALYKPLFGAVGAADCQRNRDL